VIAFRRHIRRSVSGEIARRSAASYVESRESSNDLGIGGNAATGLPIDFKSLLNLHDDFRSHTHTFRRDLGICYGKLQAARGAGTLVGE
jgi:hypothetical protein